MFYRTSLGLSNENLFYDVDLIVYCEGVETADDSSTLDEVFWTQVFEANGKKVKCKSYGSKTNLLPLAKNILLKSVSKVVVAMDRDYDHLRGTTIEHPQVIYTFGYSWESDVMLDFDFNRALTLFVNVGNWRELKVEFDCYRSNQSIVLKRVFALDFKYIGHSQKLFDRCKPMSIIDCGVGNPPCIKVKRLLEQAKKFGRYQTALLPRQTYLETCGLAAFFGKAVSRLFFHWFIFRTSNLASSRKVQYDTFMSILISTLPLDDLTQPRNSYYAELVADI